MRFLLFLHSEALGYVWAGLKNVNFSVFLDDAGRVTWEVLP